MKFDIINEKSAAKLLKSKIHGEGSETIPLGSTFDNNQEEKVALFYFYVLIDPRDNKPKYIGRTINPSNRMNNHYYEARHNNRNKRERWITKLLSLNLKPILRILHSRDCNIKQAIEIEKRLVLWFSKYYELKNSPDNYLGAVLTDKPVYQYDLNGKFVNSFINSHQANIITGIKNCNISRCCKSDTPKRAGNFMWSFFKLENLSIKYCKDWRKSKGKPILVYDKFGNFICEYLNARIASKELKISWKHISAICNKTKSGKRTKYIFKFK